MEEFIIIGSIGFALLLTTSALVYETLAILWDHLPKLRIGRLRVAVVVAGVFATHIICIWLYALVYYILLNHADIGGFAGESIEAGYYGTDLFSVVYYSTITYTSLGFGDVIPTGGLRFLSGIETLNGLVLVGWTVSYAFLAMQHFWKFNIKQ